jgi:hypothetical protein
MAYRNSNSPRSLLFEEAQLNWSRRMNRKYEALMLGLLMLLLPLLAVAQNDIPVDMTGEPPEVTPRTYGEYKVTQSIEVGERIVGVDGNGNTYNTFVNLHGGPRLLSQELSMQAAPGAGGFFDNLYASSFGFGGDPSQLARLRLQKAKWYNFIALYRRDQNYWDYNLFANPLTTNAAQSVLTAGKLNPTTLPWFTNSMHMQDETRNMGDALLTLFPVSAVSVRLGFNINNNSGMFGSSIETPIQFPISENAGWRAYRYQAGVDLKLLPKTTFSIDQFYEHDTTDLNFRDNFSAFTLGSPTGPPVNAALLATFTSAACPFSGFLIAPGVMANNSACSGLLNYFKVGNVNTNIPTTRLALRSNAFPKLDITGDGTYSRSSSDFRDYSEFISGFGPRGGGGFNNPNLAFGEPDVKVITTSADLGLTYHFTHSWSFSDKFRWLDWREAGDAPITTLTCAVPMISPTTQATPLTGGVLTSVVSPCNSAVASLLAMAGQGVSPLPATNFTFPYSSTVTSFSLLAQRQYFNTSTVNWQPSRRFGGFLGFRYTRRELTAGSVGTGNVTVQDTSTLTTTAGSTAVPLVPTLSVTTGAPDRPRINQYTGLAGVTLRPTDAWLINVNAELTYADNTFVNLYPRHGQLGRASVTYKLNHWSSLNASATVNENRNNFGQNFLGSGLNLFPTTVAPAYGTKYHYRYYTLGATLNPTERVTVVAGWTYMDQKMLTQTCMPLSPASVIVGGAPPTCPPIDNGGGFPLTLNYTEDTNSFYTNVAFRAHKRAIVNLGYQVTSDNGRNSWLRADNGQPLLVFSDIFGNAVSLNGISFNPASPVGCNGGPCLTVLGPNPSQPLGPQTFNWHAPFAGLEVALARGVSFKGTWAYYDYNEKGIAGLTVGSLGGVGPVLPRDFHANVGTLALKYAF